MPAEIVSSDVTILDLLRKQESLTVSDLATALQVTATAVRQRLVRLMAQGYIERSATRAGRGRPSHSYSLTTAGRRKTGSNFADLAIALWEEIRHISDPEVRRGLLQRISRRMALLYGPQITGRTIDEKMATISAMFSERGVPFIVERNGQLPVLTALACPYPDLAEQDRSICAMERMMFSEMLGERVHLDKCRLDGDSCCTFQTG